MNHGARALLLAGLGALALAGCHRQQIAAGAPSRLLLSVSPPSPSRLDPGTLVSVMVRPEPWVSMDWVSGTVQILGAPVAPFRRAADGSWSFRTMVPPMVSVPSGAYRMKAWGRTHAGEMIRGELTYEVE